MRSIKNLGYFEIKKIARLSIAYKGSIIIEGFNIPKIRKFNLLFLLFG